MSFIIRVAVVVGALSLLGAAGAQAARPSPQNPAGKMLGVVRPHGQAALRSRSGSNLVYHNGPVMHANKTYAIWWMPSGYSVGTNYWGMLFRYFGDVAAASGQTSNVFDSDTQYYDTTGNIAYSSTFANAVWDTDSLPASGCRDSYTSVCLTDSQIQAEIQKLMKSHGWTGGTGKVYFIFTPRNVGSCMGSDCAYTYYCAYHSWIGSGSSAILYANIPYAAFVPSACGSAQSPNNNDADSTMNLLSHEHNESITDPLGSAWYDMRGNEDGDKCAWNFGTTLGSTAYGAYNQVINGHDYYLQQEWSNASSGCVLQGL